MPARKPKAIWTPDIVRQRIRVGLIVHRLQKQAVGKLQMSAGELKACEILLAKTLPNLNATDLMLNDQRAAISDQPRTIEQWQSDAENYLGTPSGSTETPH